MASTQTVSGGKKKSSGRKNGVGGFLVDMLNREAMDAYVVKHDLAETLGGVDDDMSTEQLGVALALHFKTNVPTRDQVKCDECHSISSKTEPTCPLCGDNGEVATAASTIVEAEVVSDDEEDEDADDSDGDGATDADTDDDEDDAEDGEDDEEEEDTAAQAAPVVKKTTAKKKGSDKMSTQEVTNGVSKKSSKAAKTSTALEKSTVGTAVSTTALDKAVAEVIEIKSRGAHNYWELGHKLMEINKGNLWKLRVNPETGKNKYNGFDAFCHHELNMSSNHAYNAIDVAKKYKTPEEVRALGVTKAALLLKAAPEDRKKLTAKAKAGATKRELEKDVAASRAKNGGGKKSQQAKAGAKGGAKKGANAAARSEKISIQSIEGVKTIKLHKKPDTLKGVVFSELPRAAKIGDQPIGRFEMGNGVVQYFAVRPSDEGWVLRVETRREDA